MKAFKLTIQDTKVYMNCIIKYFSKEEYATDYIDQFKKELIKNHDNNIKNIDLTRSFIHNPNTDYICFKNGDIYTFTLLEIKIEESKISKEDVKYQAKLSMKLKEKDKEKETK